MVSSVSSSASSQIISALGGGSGIDMGALATNLAAAQFAGRIDRLTTRSDTLDKQISAAANIKSMLLTLASSLGDRVRTGDLSPQPRLANPAVAAASLTGTAIPKGTFSLEVNALASAQTLASNAYVSAQAPVGAGTLTLRFGTVSGTSFTQDAARTPINIAFASGATLSDAATAINQANAGVTAYVAQTPEGSRLVIKGADGVANGFVFEASEDPAEPGLAALAWNPAGDATRLKASAADAQVKIDGLSVVAKGNIVDGAIPGVRLALTGTNAGAPTQLSFADPGTAITSAMQDLATALNQIMGELRSATDPETGDLARDGGARSLRSAFSALAGSMVMPNAPAGAPRTLADLGLSTQRDGTYVLDTKRLAATLKAAPEETAAMFTNGLYGVYGTIDALARKATKATDPGTLAGSIGRMTALKQTTAKESAKLTEQQDALRTQLVKRFAATDKAVGASKATMSYLKNQIDAWNAQRN